MSPLAADGQRTSSSPESVSVSTVAATAVATGYHMLKVEGYSRLKHTQGKNGSYLESSAFKVAGKTWRLRCYLNGYRKEDAGFVSVGLECGGVAAGGVVHAEFEFALVHHHHGTDHPSHSQSASGTRAFEKGQPGWGFAQFISREALERSRFLEDDCFAIRCKVTVVEERKARKEAVKAQDMERLGLLLCKCDDDMCKRHHARMTTLGLREMLARFLSSMCSP